MKPKFRTVFWGAAALGIAAMLIIAFQPRPVQVDVTEAEQGPMRVTVRDEARTRVRDVYEVTAPIGGHLLRIDSRAGDHVHAGDVVARILPGDPPFLDSRAQAEARAAVRSAEAALAAARSEAQRAGAELDNRRVEAERSETLFGRELVSREAYDRAQLALSVAESMVASAGENVRMREAALEAARVRLIQPGTETGAEAVVSVRAPTSGRVLRIAQESESVVAAGALLLTLGDPADLEVVAELLSTDAVQIAAGAPVDIENWGGSGAARLNARVRLVEPFGFLKVSALGVEEQRVNVIIDFVDPPSEWDALGHGYRVEASVVTWEDEDVVQLPVAALFRSAGRWAVFRVDGDRAVLTPVEIGRDNGREAQILGGIEPGTTVVLYPGEQVSDGSRVRVRE